jgi:hypothetical protein
MDAADAEKLGALDLGLLAIVEGQALVHLDRSREDLLRAIGLLSLRLEMSDPPLSAEQQSLLVRIRAEAYYGLGKFMEAIEEYQAYLGKLPERFSLSTLGEFAAVPIFAYLRLRNVDGAMNITVQLYQRSGAVVFEITRQMLEAYRSDPEGALNQLKRGGAPEPTIHDQ